MHAQALQVAKGFRAMTAGKRPLEAVHSCLVGGQVRFGGKGAGAGGAGERSLSGVQPLVNLKAGGAAEGHRTAGTGEARQVEGGVRLQVQLQRRRVGKAPVADAADEPTFGEVVLCLRRSRRSFCGLVSVFLFRCLLRSFGSFV